MEGSIERSYAIIGDDGDVHMSEDWSDSEYEHLNKDETTGFIVINESSLCYVEYDFENFHKKPIKELFNLSSLGYFDGTEKIIIVGSCNGLVCLTTSRKTYRRGNAYICNPITQECVQLPSLFPNHQHYADAGYCYSFYGFGYLPLTNEYKVVGISYKLVSWKPAILSGKVQVYTLGDGRGWRDLGHIITTPEYQWLDCPCTFSNGALYWCDLLQGHTNISVFDLTDEKFYSIPEPSGSGCRWDSFKFAVLGGQLCYFRETTSESSVIWSLTKKSIVDNFDEKEQDPWIWSKGSTVTIKGPHINKYQPLMLTNNGDILLLYSKDLHLCKNYLAIRYDPKTSATKELGEFNLPWCPRFGKAFRHVNSYVSLKSLGKPTVFSSVKDSKDNDVLNKSEQDKEKQTKEKDDMSGSESGEYPGAGQLFGEGNHRSKVAFGEDNEDVGGFSVLKTQAPLYRQIWLKYGHIASTKVMPISMYPVLVMVVKDLMDCISDMHQCRFVELSSKTIEHWEKMIMMAEKNEFNIGWLRERLETVKKGQCGMQNVKTELRKHGKALRDANEEMKMLRDAMKKVEVRLNEAKVYVRENTRGLLSETDMETYLEIGEKLLLDGLF